ncbi:hypothetical protein AgCh_010027 [Apium graveolens]
MAPKRRTNSGEDRTESRTDPVIVQMLGLMQQHVLHLTQQQQQQRANPVESNAWLKEIEKAFNLVEAGVEQKIKLASYFLKGEANYWWESMRASEGGEFITWERFTGLFLENYFPRFVPDQIDTEEKKARRFEHGLKFWIQNRVAMFELTSYEAVVQKAMVIESRSDMPRKERMGRNGK